MDRIEAAVKAEVPPHSQKCPDRQDASRWEWQASLAFDMECKAYGNYQDLFLRSKIGTDLP